jgi:hypothetical protein
MVDVYEDRTNVGTWLRLEEEGQSVLGAFIDARTGPEDFTVMWLGDPTPTQIVRFLQEVFPMLDLGESGRMVLRGQVFASGDLREFNGSHWLSAASLPKAQFVRLRCRAERQGYGRSIMAEEIILWARLGSSDLTAQPKGDEDESVGVKLPLSRLTTVEDNLATLIASSQITRPNLGTVRQTLRVLAEHLRPRSEPTAMAM